jgi:hypothetical protein
MRDLGEGKVKQFFFEKSTKKILLVGVRVAATRTEIDKSLLLLFFRKEVLAFSY